MGGISLATPSGAVVALAGLLPLAALVAVELRARRARKVLRLRAPRTGVPLSVPVAIVAIAALLGLTAAQPILAGSRKHVRVSDGEVLIVVDTSRSMLASNGSGGVTRFARAKQAAASIRAALPGVRVGLASLTDRLLPHLLPSPNADDFALVLDRAIGVNRPPPLYPANRATTFSALSVAVTGNLFSAPPGERVAVVLTDGEGQRADGRDLSSLVPFHGRPEFVFVRFWSRRERVYTRGIAEPGYQADPQSGAQLRSLADALDGRVFSERQLGQAIAAIRAGLPKGRSRRISTGPRQTTALAPFSAAATLVPLGFVLYRRNRA